MKVNIFINMQSGLVLKVEDSENTYKIGDELMIDSYEYTVRDKAVHEFFYSNCLIEIYRVDLVI